MENRITRISPERKQELKELIEQIRQESYDQGYEDGKAFVSVESVEDNTITHEGKVLRKVNRRAVTGDFVRFNSKTDESTVVGKFYEVIENEKYLSENNNRFKVYGWTNLCPNPEVFKVVETIKSKSANQQRAELIEKAKKFVEEQKTHVYTNRNLKGEKLYVAPTIAGHYCDLEFKVDNDKRTIVALLKYIFNGKVVSRGIAKCMPGDVFNEHIGKAIALAKAMKKDIPVEFLEAVQPDEVVVGHKVRGNYAEENYEVPAFHSHEHLDGMYGRAIAIHGIEKSAWVGTEQVTIIDDTNAQYEIPS